MKTASKILILLLAAALLCGCSNTTPDESTFGSTVIITGSMEEESTAPVGETQATEPEEEYPYDYTLKSFFDYEDCYDHVPMANISGITADGQPYSVLPMDGYSVGQGAVSDGTYGYFLLSGGDGTNCLIYKIDMRTWEVVKTNVIAVEHGNGVAYNPNTNKLVVSHCTPNPELVSIVNPDTLEVEEVLDLGRGVQSITYNAKHGMYVIRVNGTWDMALLDENFEEVAYFKGVNSNLGKQCISCDDDYIYRLDSGVIADPGTEAIVVYDWDGNYVGVYRVNSTQETEALIVYNGEYYITFYQTGARVYKLDFDKSLLSG